MCRLVNNGHGSKEKAISQPGYVRGMCHHNFTWTLCRMCQCTGTVHLSVQDGSVNHRAEGLRCEEVP